MQAKQRGFSKEEFAQKALDFATRNEWTTWTPASFFKEVEPEKLYPRSWALAENHKHSGTAMARMEAYDVNGVIMWRYADGKKLTTLTMVYPVDERPQPEPERKLLKRPIQQVTDKDKFLLQQTQKIHALETEVENLNGKLKDYGRLKYQNDRLHRILKEKNDLIDKLTAESREL